MKTIIHVTPVKRSPAEVYRALTTQAGLSSWWSTDVTAEPRVGSVNFNWGFYLDSLRLYCEEGKGKPFDPKTGRSG
jgi:hypothetical protein